LYKSQSSSLFLGFIDTAVFKDLRASVLAFITYFAASASAEANIFFSAPFALPLIVVIFAFALDSMTSISDWI